ncbi:phosphate signaling complex protein PhoU [Ruficoccus sp. ZRK36]|uniref:phosphate signaling complex protein PhoU n=1 Tax=Ruficoccus sp. ZRK36 TaxID=2866311 RepID=UPI001C739CBD|nr:phosphate signaling complex protein PhoU [Ruficoccus sp. ZRK36]QYY36010.1 phosphate signaling complex protein PhoU [Ruficoccus sp. ZRK36]
MRLSRICTATSHFVSAWSIAILPAIYTFMHPFYQVELKQIRQNLVLMGERAIEVVRFSVQALVEGNPSLSDKVIEMDDRIDELELSIDSEAIRYISLRSPVASDLRLLTMAMKACHDLERVGDEATTIAKYARRMHENYPPRNLYAVPQMAEKVIEQLRNAMDSFIGEDAEVAYSVPKQDREIDDLHRQNYRELTDAIRKTPELTEQLIEMIFISKALERIGDHATNVAEDVIYLLEGDDVRHTEAVKRSVQSGGA